eukprot:1161510-Pelagomonas_calceolata.AAC.10
MLDDELRPWLLEVNHSPSFCIDSPLDQAIKEQLILDTIELVGSEPCIQPYSRMPSNHLTYSHPQPRTEQLHHAWPCPCNHGLLCLAQPGCAQFAEHHKHVHPEFPILYSLCLCCCAVVVTTSRPTLVDPPHRPASIPNSSQKPRKQRRRPRQVVCWSRCKSASPPPHAQVSVSDDEDEDDEDNGEDVILALIATCYSSHGCMKLCCCNRCSFTKASVMARAGTSGQ